MVDWISFVLPGDWGSILLPDRPLAEIFLRGTAIYLFTFAVLRKVLKRESGTVGITDLIVIVFIADAAQNAMAGGYRSVPDGMALISVLVFWAYTLDRLAYRFPAIEKLVKPQPLPLIKDGRVLLKNMRKEFVTERELQGQLRLQGIDDISKVKEAYMESDGRISVIERRGRQRRPRKQQKVL
ncbi:MAG: DUF421 domain-containing protein [Actinobacteria bacterium]|nr:MAG: DUF421 domain-containing protein [Actinomycetota bacterium]